MTVERLDGEPRPDEMPRCSARRTPMIGDAFFMLVHGVPTVMAMRDMLREVPGENHDERDGLAIFGSLMAVHLGSILYTSWQRGLCRDARYGHRRWIEDRLREREAPLPAPRDESVQQIGEEGADAGVAPVEAPIDELAGGEAGSDLVDGVGAGDEPDGGIVGVDDPAGGDAEQGPRSEDSLIVDPWEPRK